MKLRERIISFIILLVFIFTLLSSSLTPVFAVSMSNRMGSAMINFFQGVAAAPENMSQVSNEELRAYAVFLSNFFELGSTKISLLVGESEGAKNFLETVTTKFFSGDDGSNQVKIKELNDLVMKGIEATRSPLCDSEGTLLSGAAFLTSISKEEDIYFKDANSDSDNRIKTFSLSNDTSGVYRAAFKIWAAQSLDFLMGKNGIAEFNFIYVDCWGNLWGTYETNITSGTYEYKGNSDYVLVMPACMNPNSYHNEAAKEHITVNTKKSLKLPLNNVFSLSNIAKISELEKTELVNKAIYPYYSLAEAKTETGQKPLKNITTSGITIFGVSSPFNYIANTKELREWEKRIAPNGGIIKEYSKGLFQYYSNIESDIRKISPDNTKLILVNNVVQGSKYLQANQTWFGEGGGTDALSGPEKIQLYDYFYSSQSFNLVDKNKNPMTTSVMYNSSGSAGNDGDNYFANLGLVGYDLFVASERDTEKGEAFTGDYLLDSPVSTPLNKLMSDFFKVLKEAGVTYNNYDSTIYDVLQDDSVMYQLGDIINKYQEKFEESARVPTDVSKIMLQDMNDINWYEPFRTDAAGYSKIAGKEISEFVLSLNTKFDNRYFASALESYISPFYLSDTELTNRKIGGESSDVYVYTGMNSLLVTVLNLMGIFQGEIFTFTPSNGVEPIVPRYLTGLSSQLTPIDEFNNVYTFKNEDLVGSTDILTDEMVTENKFNTFFGIGVEHYAFAIDALNDKYEHPTKSNQVAGLATTLNTLFNKGASEKVQGNFNYRVTDNIMFQNMNNYTLFGLPKAYDFKNLESIDTTIEMEKDKIFHRTAFKTSLDNTNLMGMFFSYLVEIADLRGGGTEEKDGETVIKYDVTAFSSSKLPIMPSNLTTGGTLQITPTEEESGVVGSEDLTLERMKTDLLKKINGILSEDPNEYRNTWIKSVLDGFLVSTHRAITGSWIGGMSTVSNGGTNSYASVVGYINTPSLRELSFTSWIMNNYIQIYTLFLIIVAVIIIFMVLLNMRTWKQGVATFLIMCLALLMPNILIENTINIGNKITDTIYSDRFDYWAIIQQMQSYNNLRSAENLDPSSMEYILANNKDTAENVYSSDAGVRVKWMAPKKLNTFNQLYTNTSMSQEFSSNLTIFKWLFSSFIYESEFEYSDSMSTYLYRPYNAISKEGREYYNAAMKLSDTVNLDKTNEKINNLLTKAVESDVREKIDFLSLDLSRNESNLIMGSENKTFFNNYSNYSAKGLEYSPNKLFDIYSVRPLPASQIRVSSLTGSESNEDIVSLVKTNSTLQKEDMVEYWGIGSTKLNDLIFKNGVSLTEGSQLGTVNSELEAISLPAGFVSSTLEEFEMSAFLKNTESPYYYFYNVLRSRYGESTSFKANLLKEDVFKVSKTLTLSDSESEEKDTLFNLSSTNVSVRGKVKDFLDLEGLFTTVIPYLSTANEYVYEWTGVNGLDVPDYDFNNGTAGGSSGADTAFKEAQNKRKEMYTIWSMYSSWVDQLNSLDVYTQKAGIAGKKIRIDNALNPSAYLKTGRPMIFSEADMIAKGYNINDLTDIERRIQSVLDKTYEDLQYLINYYDMENEVLLSAAAMYATFNFNSEFSQARIFGDAVMIYPQGYEMKNFNYDAFMRLMLMNSTGESVFASKDLYVSVLGKTSFITGVLLLIVDVMAVIVIPTMKLIILLMLLFLGLLLCVTCVVSPPDKLLKAISNSLVTPAFLFLLANVSFAFLVSILVGEGLTQYVGSKMISIATNDPTITIAVLLILSALYIFVLFKIIKKTWKSMKEYGLNTILGTIGIASAGVAGIAGRVGGAVSRLGSAAVGAATAGKGNRLAGAADGFANKDILSKNADARRTARALGAGSSRKSPLSDSDAEIDKKRKDGSSDGASGASGTTEGASVDNAKNNSSEEKKTKTELKLDKKYEKKDKRNETKHNMRNAFNGMKPSEIVKKAKEKNSKKQEYKAKKEKSFLEKDKERSKQSGITPIQERREQKEINRNLKQLGHSRKANSYTFSSQPSTSSPQPSNTQVKGKKRDNTSVKKKKRRKKNAKNGNNSGNNYGKSKH